MKFIIPLENDFTTNRNEVYRNDDTLSLVIVDLIYYGPANHKRCGNISLVFDSFSKHGRTVSLKNKTSQTKKDSFENIPISSKRKPNLYENCGGKNFWKKVSKIFWNWKKSEEIARYSPEAQYLLKAVIEVLEVSLKNMFLKQVMLIG